MTLRNQTKDNKDVKVCLRLVGRKTISCVLCQYASLPWCQMNKAKDPQYCFQSRLLNDQETNLSTDSA